MLNTTCVNILRLALFFICFAGIADDTLLEGFREPPQEAKPHVWWHWMNGNVSKAGITADLEAMASAGIGGAQIFDVSDGICPGPVVFNSDAWMDMEGYGSAPGQPLCALAHGAMAEPQKPAALSAEICHHLLRGTSAYGASPTAMAGLPTMREMKLTHTGIDRKKQLYYVLEIPN